MENEANQDAQPKETIAIQIILTSDGGIKLQGPVLGDRTASYGLLETAKDMVREMHTPRRAQDGIQTKPRFVRQAGDPKSC